jgi:hypothetical protein
MKILLTHSPLDDPTIPYHSNAYLTGHLVHCGFGDVKMRDTNVEFFNWCLEEPVLERFGAEARDRLAKLGARGELGFQEQEEYFGLWSQPDLACTRVHEAAGVLRTRGRFFDFDAYQESVQALQSYFCVLAALSYPSDIGNFRQASRGRFSQCNLRDLFDPELGGRICRPLLRFLDERMTSDPDFEAADLIGVSIVYEHQMFHALQYARWLKRRWPEKQVLFGGTSISQLYKYLKDKRDMKYFFELVDGVVAGEGETAICQIAEAGEVAPGLPVQNLITYDAGRDEVHLPQHIHYENVAALGRPIYEHDWELYLSPERGINYSPSRGCYWNKCTFCDYGLNTATPTSPWRERRIEQVIEDLRHAVDDCGARFVYFAVDVMSPSYLDRLSDALVESGLGLRWGAEIRMERVFSPERCRKIQASGCVHVSFGMESGTQRILDLIDKGTRIEYMSQTMRNFAEAGVAVHLFTFTGFPTETPEEAQQTREFIRANREWWSGGGLGSFLLTGTAIVARDPARFGVELLETEGADVARSIAYKLTGEDDGAQPGAQEEGASGPAEGWGDGTTAVSTESADASFDDAGGLFPGFLGRPWAGSTDCLHTMIYYEAYDRTFFRLNDIGTESFAGPETQEELLSCTVRVPGILRESPFSLGAIVEERRHFVEWLGGLARRPEEPTLPKFQRWSAERPFLPRSETPTYWVRSGERVARLDKLVYRLLKVADATQLPLRELLEVYPESLRPKLMSHLRDLGKRALLELRPPGVVAVAERPLRKVPLPERRPGAVYSPSVEERQPALRVLA